MNDIDILRIAVSRLDKSLNKVSNPMVSAIAVGRKMHFGVNIFLSNCTIACAEQNALAASAGDKVHTLYIVSSRRDTKHSTIIYPCGNCRQWIHDFNPKMRVVISTSELKEIVETNSMLPNAFESSWRRYERSRIQRQT